MAAGPVSSSAASVHPAEAWGPGAARQRGAACRPGKVFISNTATRTEQLPALLVPGNFKTIGGYLEAYD